MKSSWSIAISFLIYSIVLLALPADSPSGQESAIGIVDFYGLRNVSEQKVRQALEIKEGDALPKSMKEVQRRLENLTDVEQARLNVACCEAGQIILYVGIREKGSPSLRFRAAPKGAIRLPENIVQAGEDFQDAFGEAVQKGDLREDDSQGHALFDGPKYALFKRVTLRSPRVI